MRDTERRGGTCGARAGAQMKMKINSKDFPPLTFLRRGPLY